MLRILLLACLSLAQVPNAGFVFSRGYLDQSLIVKNLAPSLLANFTVQPDVVIPFKTRDFITQVTVNMEGLVMKDFIIQPSNVNVSFTSPKYMGVGISNLTCNVYYNYTEVGFNINNTGSAIATFSESTMIINFIVYFFNGSLAYYPDYSNFTMKISKSSTISDTMSSFIIDDANTNMRDYWNEAQNQEVVVKAMDDYFQNDSPYVNYNYVVPGTSIFMQGTVETPGLLVGDDYIASQLNGTFGILNGKIDYSISQNIPLPFRVNAAKYSKLSQVVISNYTLTSYFKAISDYYKSNNLTELPNGYPNYLTTNNGYFPELLAKYGTTNLALITNLPETPMVFILSTGILIRMKINCNMQVLTSGSYVSVVNFIYNFDYTCTPTVKGDIVYGICYKPRSVKLTISQNQGGVSTVGLKKYISDLIQTTFYAGDTYYYFPTIPLSYPKNTTISEFYVDYGTNYFAISFNPVTN